MLSSRLVKRPPVLALGALLAMLGFALSGFLVSAREKHPLSVSSAPVLDPAAANAAAVPHAISSGDPIRGGVSVANVKGLLWATTVLEAHRTTAHLKRSLGGSIEIPQPGLRITVPANALPSDMTITVTAVPGRILAYEFAPHGVVFLKPLTFSQDLRRTNHGLTNDSSSWALTSTTCRG